MQSVSKRHSVDWIFPSHEVWTWNSCAAFLTIWRHFCGLPSRLRYEF